MSNIYKAQEGDTFSIVARAVYGDDTLAAKLLAANPTLFEPFTEGTILQTPAAPKAEAGFKGDELEIIVDGFSLKVVDNFSLNLAIDAIAKARFSVPNEKETRLILKPLSEVEVKIGFFGALQFTGNCAPTANGNVLDVECSALCGAIERINAPVSAYPLEFKDLALDQITEYLCNPLGLTVVFNNPPGARFSRVDLEQETLLLEFLSRLAKQRNFVTSSNEQGELVMWRETALGAPIARLEADKFPIFSTPKAEINVDSYYSVVTGVIEAEPKKGKRARSFSVKNPYAKNLIRPYNFVADDVDDSELELVVNTVAARMFGGVFSINLQVASWRDDEGSFWRPNTTVEYKDPRNFVEDFYEFVISEVLFEKLAATKTASLKLTLPGCYGGVMPKRLPWPL